MLHADWAIWSSIGFDEVHRAGVEHQAAIIFRYLRTAVLGTKTLNEIFVNFVKNVLYKVPVVAKHRIDS